MDFYYPVDPDALELENYTNVITKPMDLGTIWDNLKANKYKEPEDVKEDVIQMLDNCHKYYEPLSHPVLVRTRQFYQIFLKR